jgi:thioredoxin 1
MKRIVETVGIVLLILALTGGISEWAWSASGSVEVPVKGVVTMVDLGATRCIPCKMMAPILERLKKKYAGRAAIVFLDVWEDPAPGRHFEIRAIPTQIFFNKKGEEVYRHIGFMSEEAIVTQLKLMGVN